jgi:O-antigen ligase
MIQDAPILGFGWNSFGDVAQRYAAVPLDVDADIDFSIIHNTVISDMQQAGLSGFVLAALPFIVLIGWSTAPTWMTFCTLASFLVAAELGDIGYSSLTWLWLALLINMKSAAAGPPASRTEVASGKHSYKPHMSGTQHSAS